MAQFKPKLLTPVSNNVTLRLDHWHEELTPAQKAYYNRAEKEYNDITNRLNELVKTKQAEIIEAGEEVLLVEVNGSQNPSSLFNKNVAVSSFAGQSPMQNPSISHQPVVLQSPPALCPTGPSGNIVSSTKAPGQNTQFGGSGGTIQLVMSPQLGLIVGSVPGQDGTCNIGTAGPITQRNPVPTMSVPPPPAETRTLATQPSNQPNRAISVSRVAKVSPLSQSFLTQPYSQPTPTAPPPPQPKLVFSVGSSAPSNPPTQSSTTCKPRILSSTSLATTTAAPTTTSNSSVPRTYTISQNYVNISTDNTTHINTVAKQGIKIVSTVGGVGTNVGPKNTPSKLTSNVPPKVTQNVPPKVTQSVTPKVTPNPKVVPNSTQNVTPNVTSKVPPNEKLADETSNSAPDSREIAFNKVAGKTFPSLVVLARPYLKDKELTPQIVTKERAVLDAQVKSVLIFSPTKFTEWLIQQGLVRSEQVCPVHMTDGKPTKLKLGMYSDVSKFPFSGGYVWISDCCPHRFVSVFSGSIFEGSPHPPSTLLKLMYHWCCQTTVQNVVHWVKVDNFYVKNFYTNMRTICTAAVHEKYEKMGGRDKTIEVGVISLGTTSQGGNMRQVKVEVLGVMDPENKRIRLRAVEPLQDGERVYKKRFIKILEPLEQWVDKESIIVTDFTVDKSTLITMGFRNVIQVSLNDTQPRNNRGNHNVMDYLRRIVPRMFQNTLSLLSRQIIQQFLDELVWRERWGPIPVEAFNNLILHLSQQTKLNSGESLLLRLARIASNPFRDWRYANWTSPTNTTTTAVVTRPAVQPTTITPRAAVPTTPNPAPAPVSTESPITITKSSRPAKGAAQELRLVKEAAEEILNTANQAKNGPEQPKPPNEPKTSITPTVTNVKTQDTPVVRKYDQLIPLDNYYFAQKPGNGDVVNKEFKTEKLNAKCCICQKIFATNVEIMQHLMAHSLTWETYSEGNEGQLDDVANRMCRYCLGLYPHPIKTIAHADETHRNLDYRPACLICEVKFRDRQSLIAHMHRFHVEVEMPYRCGICDYRSSEKALVIDHFYDVHSKGEELQCPFCLRCVAVSKNGRKINSNTYFFYNHVRKHQLKYLSKQCNRCALTFVHKDILKEHQNKDHKSNKDVAGILRRSETDRDQVMMPFPPTLKSDKVPQSTNKRTEKLPLLTSHPIHVKITNAYEDDACVECQYSLLKESHFSHHLSCLRCRYSTCCGKAMEYHVQNAHSPDKKPCFPTTTALMLPTSLFCPCGFNSSNTNSLAKHMSACDFTTLYPEKQSAAETAERVKMAAEEEKKAAEEEQAATLPLLSIAEGGEDGAVSPNVLNKLGLIAKPKCPDEDEASQDDDPILERSIASKNGRRSASITRKRKRGNRGVLQHDSEDTESVDDVASLEGNDDSQGSESMKNAKQRRIV